MTVDMRLVKKGRSEPRDALSQQAKRHLSLAQQHAAELAEGGWSAEDTAALEVNIPLLDAAIGSQSSARDASSGATRDEGRAIDDVKAYLRRLRNGLPRALREGGQAAGVTQKSFQPGEELGRSTPKLSAYLAKIRPAVEKLDEPLRRAFKGEKASEALDTVKQALDGADQVQETALVDAPKETLRLYELMGRALEQIEDMNRAGRTAFEGDALMRGSFNKDILLRGRKQARKPREEGGGGDGDQ